MRLSAAELAGSVKDLGLTEAIRAVCLTGSSVWLGATEVKEQLDGRAFNWSSYTQPMSAIHTVLKRLHEAGQLDSKAENGRTVYKWVGNIERRIRERSRAKASHGT